MSSRIVFGSSRAGGHDWTSYFPSIAEAAIQLGPATTILDGEAVVLKEKGVPNFYAFALLYFDGHDLTSLELSARRHLLDNLLDGEIGAIRLSEEIASYG